MDRLTDNQLKMLLRPHRDEIPDNGFTQRVMLRLPTSKHQHSYQWVVWLFTIVGLLLTLLSGAYTSLMHLLVFESFRLSEFLNVGWQQIQQLDPVLFSYTLGTALLAGLIALLFLPKIQAEVR